MTKGDVSFALVALVAMVAWLVVVETRRRRKRGGSARRDSSVSSEEAAVVVEDVSSPSKEIAVASPVRSALTARERRVEEVQQRAVAGRCLYCRAEAEHPMPYALFSPPSGDLAAILTGDLPRHWRVRVVAASDAVPTLCAAHLEIARSAVELRIARAHAEYVAFVAAQKEDLYEWSTHGFDEAMRAESDRVRKGAPREGKT